MIKCLRESTYKQSPRDFNPWSLGPIALQHIIERACNQRGLVYLKNGKEGWLQIPFHGHLSDTQVSSSTVDLPEVLLPSNSTMGCYWTYNTWPCEDTHNAKYCTSCCLLPLRPPWVPGASQPSLEYQRPLNWYYLLAATPVHLWYLPICGLFRPGSSALPDSLW